MNYYNYKLDEVMELEVNKYNTLVTLMYVNIARENLRENETACYPKYKDGAKEQIHRKLNKVAYPSNFEVKNVVKLGDLSKVLNG